MCGIAGAFRLDHQPVKDLPRCLAVMNHLLSHRGPDGSGTWLHEEGYLGFAHRRLSIIDLATGDQPMRDEGGNWITFNGEIYNYLELREELGPEHFRTTSDTEVILLAYRKWGRGCVDHLRGMFAFAIWDARRNEMFCARDRFGVKPFYWMQVDGTIYFASEVKALLPFAPDVSIHTDALRDYLTFQFCLAGKTLFQGVHELLPGHCMIVNGGAPQIQRYWEVYFDHDYDHTDRYFQNRLDALLKDSVHLHLRSDVPVGAYISGGLDSSLVAALATEEAAGQEMAGFTGKFSAYGEQYDESRYAAELASQRRFPLEQIDIGVTDFIENIERLIYHMDYPAAGPGALSQYMVSRLAARHRKVVLGGQGGDEIFGGYTRYLVAYFEQCIRGAIEGTMDSGNFIVTYESIIPNLVALRNYKPMLREFWKEGLFEPMDRRYFRMVNRAPTLEGEVRWDLLGEYDPFETFREIFAGKNVRKESYFDLMTHFDFKTLLPALLQVEDRVSMAHGLESRVPLLDHPLVEFAATIPSNIKFHNGDMKHVFKEIAKPHLPESIWKRKDKMGFPTPLNDWIQGDARDFVRDIFFTGAQRGRELLNTQAILDSLDSETQFGRKIWGLLCLELWQQTFCDRAAEFRRLRHCDEHLPELM